MSEGKRTSVSRGRRALTRRGAEDEGAVAVIFSIALVVLFLIVGLAVDLGMARADVRDNQTVSDFASVAGAAALNLGYVVGCQEALNYVYTNARELSPPPPAAALAECNDTFATLDANECTGETLPETATIEAGPYIITITSPVPDDHPSMVLEGQVATPLDGDPCMRLRVGMTRVRDYVFGPVGGILSGAPAADAIALGYLQSDPDDPDSLIVLEQEACNALTATGASAGSGIFVLSNEETGAPGTIAVDSAGDGDGGNSSNDCLSGSRYTVNNNSATIMADGAIRMFAITAGNPGTAHPPSPDPDKLGNALLALPQRQTRSAVDWLINCRPGGYDPYATHHRFPYYGDVDPCPFGDDPEHGDHVDTLFTQLQSGSLVDLDFVEINDCNTDLSVDGAVPGTPTRYHVTCEQNAVMEFRNVDAVVFNERVSNERLIIDGPPGTGTVVYFRGPGLRQTTGPNIDPCQDPEIDGDENGICLRNVFVYIGSKGDTGNQQNNPSVRFNGGRFTWTGMLMSGKEDNCAVVDDLPTAACFAPVALWANSTKEHSFEGGGGALVSGSFFTPNAFISLAGGSGFDFRDSQFFARRIEAKGGGRIELVPNPETNVPPPRQLATLIR